MPLAVGAPDWGASATGRIVAKGRTLRPQFPETANRTTGRRAKWSVRYCRSVTVPATEYVTLPTPPKPTTRNLAGRKVTVCHGIVAQNPTRDPGVGLSQAFRRPGPYGTTQHRGILAGPAILKLYCECLGTTWTGNPARDPIVFKKFFRTADTADTSKWQRLPAEFDKSQAKAYSFAPLDHPTASGRNSDRSSGLGLVSSRPPTIV